MILCVDPSAGKNGGCGAAIFRDGRVSAATVIRPRGIGFVEQFETALDVVTWSGPLGVGDVFVGEWMQVYPGERKDPNKALLPLCGVVAHVSGMLTPHACRVVYRPHEWKGSINGDAFVERIRSRLDAAELKVLDAVEPAYLRHNAADAVGLGLKHLGRLERRRVVHR